MCVVTTYGVQCCKGEKICLFLNSVLYVRTSVGVMVCLSQVYKAGKACQLCGR